MIHALAKVIEVGVSGFVVVLIDDVFGYRRHMRHAKHFDSLEEARAWLDEYRSTPPGLRTESKVCIGRDGFWQHRKAKW